MARSSSKKAVSVNVSKERLDALSKLLVDDVTQIVTSSLREWLNERAVLLAKLLMNAEVIEKVGDRYERNADRDCVRWGKQAGSVLVLEQRVPVEKPRIRTKGGWSEIELTTYEQLNSKEFLNEQATAKLLSGVSTRRFGKTLEKVVRGRGVGRQTISQRGIEEMSNQLQDFQNRSLEGADIVVVFADGIHLGDTVFVTAVGIDSAGKRYVLGFEPGSTESAGVCRGLLSNLIERGILNEAGGYLFVVDGGKGLQKAIKEVFGGRAEIQRCTVHKARNVKEKLPKNMHQEFHHRFNSAYNENTLTAAQKGFSDLRNWLLLTRRSAAANSLLEGQQQLLTLHRLGVRGTLRRSLCTTNCIESVFSAARYYSRNVKRWRKEEQMERWLATGLLEAEKKLRKLPGYTNLKYLKQALLKSEKAS